MTSLTSDFFTFPKIFSISRIDYRYIRRVNPISTFIPGISRDEYEFRNAKKGVVGMIPEDGIEVSSN